MVAPEIHVNLLQQLGGGSVRKVVATLLTRPDPCTPEGRAAQRHRNAALTAISAAVARAIAMGSSLLTVPITLHYLGVEQYGMWMAMSSTIAMFSFADLGIGNGILNAVATAYGRDDKEAVKKVVSSGMFALSLISAAIIVAFTVAYRHVDWSAIFNIHTVSGRAEAGPTLAVLAICFALGIPASIIQRVQMGLQAGFMAEIWDCVRSLFSLAAVLAAVHFKASLPWLLLALSGSPLLASALNTTIFFRTVQPVFAPAFRAISLPVMRQIVNTGGLFFVLQIVGAMGFASDEIILAHILGPAAVAAYSIPRKLFSFVGVVLMMALVPLWPAYAEATAKGDAEWVRKTLKRSLALATGFALAAAIPLVVFGNFLIHTWVGGALKPSFALLAGLGTWQVVQSAGNSVAMFTNGTTQMIKFQLLVSTVTGCAMIALKIFFVKKFGIPGVVWGGTIGYVACAAAPLYWRVTSELRRAQTPARQVEEIAA